MHIQDNAPLTLMAVTDGVAWIVPDGGEPVPLTAGDVALVRGTDHYRLADHPDTEPQVIIHPGQICTTLDGHDLAEEMGLGVRTWGNTAYGSKTASHLLIGVYEIPARDWYPVPVGTSAVNRDHGRGTPLPPGRTPH